MQRVSEASVTLPDGETRCVGRGLLVLLGVGVNDTPEQAVWLASKTARLRIFRNGLGKFDLSVTDIKGSALVISQFTLYGDCGKGARPDFTAAARPETAVPLYELYVSELKKSGIAVLTGEFGADMKVALVNDGPVTVLLEKENA
ncbi:MAG: D-aminoacyl-tRNA deacylase [Elusimicrobiaceae bacterium]|nr:D-aminoacyl-tRNA deacylase [Elusimicrobiaceae bacterium]